MSLNDLNLSYSRFNSLKSQGAEKWTTLSTTVASEGMHHNEIQPYRVSTMSSKGEESTNTEIGDLSEEDIGHILTIIATDGYYKQAEIVKVVCPSCGEEFLGTKRHAGGFIAGHRAYHEFENSLDIMIENLGGA